MPNTEIPPLAIATGEFAAHPVSGPLALLMRPRRYLASICVARADTSLTDHLRKVFRIKYAADALGVGGTGSGGMPRALWSGRLQPERDETEELGLRAA